MKKNRHFITTALCPFYKEQDAMRIFCMGMELGTSISVNPVTNVDGKRHLEDYQNRYCRKNYKGCPICLGHLILIGEVKIQDDNDG